MRGPTAALTPRSPASPHEILGTARTRTGHPLERSRLRHASRTATGCASRSRSRTPTGSGCRTSASRRSTGSSTPRTTSSASGCSCRRSRSCAELLGAGAPLVTLESQTPVARLRRHRVLGVVRVGLHQRPDAAAAGRHAAARRASARTRDPLVVIGGAVTFVNPEPLALFADVIAAGEGEVLVPRCVAAVREAPRSRRPAAAARRASAASTSRRSTTSRYAADGTIAGFVPRAGTGAPPVVKKAALKTHRGASTRRRRRIFTPDTEFGSRFLVEVVRGCANLCRFCWAGYNYLPVRAFPDRPHPRSWPQAARAHSEPRRPGVDRALRSPGDRAHPRAACSRWATRSARRRCGSTT